MDPRRQWAHHGGRDRSQGVWPVIGLGTVPSDRGVDVLTYHVGLCPRPDNDQV